MEIQAAVEKVVLELKVHGAYKRGDSAKLVVYNRLNALEARAYEASRTPDDSSIHRKALGAMIKKYGAAATMTLYSTLSPEWQDLPDECFTEFMLCFAQCIRERLK